MAVLHARSWCNQCLIRQKRPHQRLASNLRGRSSRAVITASSLSHEVDAWQPGTLLLAQSDTNGDMYWEVVASSRHQGPAVMWQGRLMHLTVDGSMVTAEHAGTFSDAFAPVVRSFPGWQQCAAKLQAQLSEPKQLVVPLDRVTCASSLQQLEVEVQQQPGKWCDGTAPGDPPVEGLDRQLLNAGELVALLLGLRGVAMIQLHQGWDQQGPQPVLTPFVLTLLQRALSNADITTVVSPLPNDLGLTALLSAKKEPFKSWSKHLASFNAQAALVAESPYYKLLIGRVLGYKDDNIIHYIRMTNGPAHPGPQVVAAVDQDLKKLSAKKPSIPWNTSSRGKGKKAATARG